MTCYTCPLRIEAAGVVGFIPQARSDEKGRFRIAPLILGQHYSAEISGGQWDNDVLGDEFENLVLRAGEVRDLGEIRAKPIAQ
jgi:hypothetical protein